MRSDRYKRMMVRGIFSACLMIQANAASFVPLPALVQQKEGVFQLTDTTEIHVTGNLKQEAQWLAQRLSLTSGKAIRVTENGSGISLAIDEKLPTEGYVLDISAQGVTIRGGSAAGVFYGCVTFLQSLPADVFGSTLAKNAKWKADAVHIEDQPAMTWRGMHLDSARHFQPKAFIFKFIDAMSAQKLNRLHWHLVDSEAWRMEVKKYPKLVEVAAKSPAYYAQEIPTNPTLPAKYRYGHFHGGGYYTQEDIKEIVAYAQARHVTIVPEIEFPGHAMAALTAYPEFSTTGKVPTVASNISPDLIAVTPKAIQFLKNVMDETMELFPGKWIHFGGDEAPKDQWANDPYTQKRIDELKLRVKDGKKHSSENMLQAWLFNQMTEHIAKKGRVALGWEEIAHGKNVEFLAKSTVVMPWLSPASGVSTANAGYDIIHSAFQFFYLDTHQVEDISREPSVLYSGPRTLETIYQYNLFPDGLTEEGKKHVIGAQVQLWSELMPRSDDIEYQAYPRACALAELTWTAQSQRNDVDGFRTRLADHGARLTALGLNHRRVTRPSRLQNLSKRAASVVSDLTKQSSPLLPSVRWDSSLLASESAWVVDIPESAYAKGRTITLTFHYESGDNGVKIQSVEMLAKDAVIAKDEHAGFAGQAPQNHKYKLTLPEGQSTKGTSFRIRAKGEGGNDGQGVITFE